MSGLREKLWRASFVAAVCLTSANSFAAGVKYEDLTEGAVVTEDRVDMGFLSPIPIPPGKWRILTRSEYVLPWDSLSGDLEMTRVTFVNTDKDAPIQLFSFSTNKKRYLRVGASPLYKCQDFSNSVFTQKQFDLSASGFVYACAQIRSNPNIKSKFESLAKSQINADSRGYLNGLMKPLLESPADLQALGSAPVSVELEVSKNAERLTYYSFYLKSDRPYTTINAQMPEIAQLNQWLIHNGKEIIKSINGDEFKLTQLSAPLVFSGSEVPAAPQVDPSKLDTMTLPTDDPKNRASYKKFVETAPSDNRAFYFTENGRFWGWQKNSWPFNEREALNTCLSVSRGSGSGCKLHTMNNELVWSETVASR